MLTVDLYYYWYVCKRHAYYDCVLLFPLWHYSEYHHDTNDAPLNNLSLAPIRTKQSFLVIP